MLRLYLKHKAPRELILRVRSEVECKAFLNPFASGLLDANVRVSIDEVLVKHRFEAQKLLRLLPHFISKFDHLLKPALGLKFEHRLQACAPFRGSCILSVFKIPLILTLFLVWTFLVSRLNASTSTSTGSISSLNC